MIKIENTEVVGWEAAIRGMRNPMNSWEKSDTCFTDDEMDFYDINGNCGPFNGTIKPEMKQFSYPCADIGPNDLELIKKLRNSGTDHRKFMRMIVVYADVTAPLYWWKEYDTYKVGTVANSCSTMHKIADKEFTLDDFSHEHLVNRDDGTKMSYSMINRRNSSTYGAARNICFFILFGIWNKANANRNGIEVISIRRNTSL